MKLIHYPVTAQVYTVQSSMFKPVERLYPDTRVVIKSVWKEGSGWVSFTEMVKLIPPYIQVFRSMLLYLVELGYTVIQLQITRLVLNQEKQIATPDFKIGELLG